MSTRSRPATRLTRAGLAPLAILASAVLPRPAAANPQDVLLGERRVVTPEASVYARDIALGDVDLDGDLDLAIARAGTEALWLGDDEGLFTRSVGAFPDPAQLSETWALVLFDADGDGDLDALGGNGDPYLLGWGEQANELWLGDGAGGFTDASGQIIAAPDITSSLAVGDLDLDGDLDVLVGNSGNLSFGCAQDVVLWNDGAGVFGATYLGAPPPCTQTRAVALFDVESDGDLDAWVGDLDAGWLYLNDGGGGLAPAPLPAVTPGWILSADAGDFDGDLDLDLVVGRSAAGALLLVNDGSGTFADESHRLPDDIGTTPALRLVDVDLDQDLDIVVGRPSGRDRMWENVGPVFIDETNAWLPESLQGSIALRAADLDRDGDFDLLSSQSLEQRVRRLWSAGKGRLDLPPRPLPFQQGLTRAALLLDVDGDRLLDAVTASNNASNRLLLGIGAGFLEAAPRPLPGAGDATMALAAGDVDGDGDLDLLLGNGVPVNMAGHQNRLLLGDGAGGFSDAGSQVPVGIDNTRALALGDVDSDGDLDALLGNYNQPDRLDLNDGTGTFTASSGQLPAVSLRTEDLALGDVDGDGDPDLVIGAWFEQNYLLTNDGAGSFADATATGMPALAEQTNAVLLGDVDRDGDLDLLVANRVQAGLPVPERLHLNDGAGVFTDAPAQLPTATTAANAVALGDVDGDGDPDLVFGGDLEDRLYLNDGTGSFVDASDRMDGDPSRTWSLVLGDVDLDGDRDLLVAGDGADRLLANRTRHLAWRAPPRVGKDLVLEVDGPPGGAAAVLASLGEGFLAFAGVGVLLVDRAQVFAVHPTTLDADGSGSVLVAIPPDPALVGVTWSWQALVLPPRRLTNLERTEFTAW